jgi:[acyl-carrier-protein] S-malonyltransferase
VYQNVDGKQHPVAEEIMRTSSPTHSSVRWTSSVQNMIADGATTSRVRSGQGPAGYDRQHRQNVSAHCIA